MAQPRILLLETSQKVGWTAVARGEEILGRRRLDSSRRHARDLAPSVQELLKEQNWRAEELDGLFVSRGPGSYTGLRVGIMSAKTLAYVAGCRLLAIDSFLACACQAPAELKDILVLADAQQGKAYSQRYQRGTEGTMVAVGPLTIRPFTEIFDSLPKSVVLTGPGLEIFRDQLRVGYSLVDESDWQPTVAGLLRAGQTRWQTGERDDPFAVEPLYLRPSSAEEQWDRKKS